MATRLYGAPLQATDYSVTEGVGSATASKPIELTVDLAVVTKKEDVIFALEAMRNKIVKENWPPA